MSAVMLEAFRNELEKIALSAGLSHVGKVRSGARPISVSNLIEKHKDGTYLKKKADSAGSPQDVRGDSVDDPGAAQPLHRRGEVPTKGSDNVSVTQKTGSSGYQEITQPISNGEEMRAGNSKPRAYGEVPCQDQYIDVDKAKRPIGGRPITSDVSAKKPKPGDTPTSDRNMNLVDRGDMRENTTTVTGLGQGSTGIGAFNSPAEHY